ncbi:hypothetical protein AVEN_127787-1 [Araneus ventricosus]|uniref:Uncharacterized protein n=1 Tax=Araneus ventricosus TaxID=182803 RepID=A0A4Y2DR91_ARAVE|nr:hypothetical protein AVEN_127787-1 [Araneus ventricosus]
MENLIIMKNIVHNFATRSIDGAATPTETLDVTEDRVRRKVRSDEERQALESETSTAFSSLEGEIPDLNVQQLTAKGGQS